jgi:hypothetical protein
MFYLRQNWFPLGGESYDGGNIVKMSKASKMGNVFYGLGDKATQMNLKGKGWKILPLINMLSERSRTFIQSSSLFYWVTK